MLIQNAAVEDLKNAVTEGYAVKNTLSVRLVPLFVLFLMAGCSKNPVESSQGSVEESPSTVVVQAEPVVEETDVIGDLEEPATLEDRFSYTYGYLLYSSMVQQKGFSDLEASYFAKGILDADKGQGFYTQEEMSQTLYEVQTKLLQIAQEEMDAISAANLKVAEDFLKTNKERESVKITDSGLQYEVIVEGEGDRPTEDSIVEVDYQIMLLNGKIIDSSYEREQSSTFLLEAIMVPGFIEGVKLMQEGAKYRFWIHPDLAYGKEGTETIEPNSLLIIEVELKSIRDGR
ncbi:MAG: FKBP-type peptidyl-prolyl cis-trans isomerase [Sphaerochaeta sp.]|uniref:FKBP-type peptidyl-prolyl cis-trans isomerase n=1 Tax=Sphaerochaeta sp. TaxID=1972642 RepID=UPI003D0EF2B4